MNASEIIQELAALRINERKQVLRHFAEVIEEAQDEALFDVRSKEPDGTPFREVLSQVNGPSQPRGE